MIPEISWLAPELCHIIYSYLPLKDACQLSKCSRYFRAIFWGYLHLREGDKISLRSLQNRCEMISPSLLKDVGIICKQSQGNFISLALYEVKALQKIDLVLHRLSTRNAPADDLLKAASRAIAQGNLKIFMAIAQSPSMKTIVSTEPRNDSIMHHSRLLSYIIRECDTEALKQFIDLPAFSMIPNFENLIIDGEEVSIVLSERDMHFVDLMIDALAPYNICDFDEKKAFMDVLFSHEKFRQIETYPLALLLSSVLEDSKVDVLSYVSRQICPRITRAEFLQAHADYYSGYPLAQTRKRLSLYFNLLSAESVSFKLL